MEQQPLGLQQLSLFSFLVCSVRPLFIVAVAEAFGFKEKFACFFNFGSLVIPHPQELEHSSFSILDSFEPNRFSIIPTAMAIITETTTL